MINRTVAQHARGAVWWVAQNLGAPKKDAGPPRKFVIEKLLINGSRAHFGSGLAASIPDVQVRDIGRKTNGATAGDVVKQLWRATVGGVGGIAANFGPVIKDGATRLLK